MFINAFLISEGEPDNVEIFSTSLFTLLLRINELVLRINDLVMQRPRNL